MSPHAPPRAILRVLSDERLARHAAGGSQHAFSILHDRHARELLAACRAIVRDEDDARDALQSTMLNAWRAVGSRDHDAPVRAWLLRIARNESITVLRRRRPVAELHEDVTTRPDVHEEAAGRAELAGVLDGLDDLTERQREALVLRTLGDAGYDEIARRQATSPQAVRQSVAHARRTLRRRRLAGLIPVPAWLTDLAASAGTGGAPAVQAGVAKTAVGVTAAVAVVGGAIGPASAPRRAPARHADAAASTTAAASAARPGRRAAVASVAAPVAAPALASHRSPARHRPAAGPSGDRDPRRVAAPRRRATDRHPRAAPGFGGARNRTPPPAGGQDAQGDGAPRPGGKHRHERGQPRFRADAGDGARDTGPPAAPRRGRHDRGGHSAWSPDEGGGDAPGSAGEPRSRHGDGGGGDGSGRPGTPTPAPSPAPSDGATDRGARPAPGADPPDGSSHEDGGGAPTDQ